jgi:hypothetical protein
MVSCGLPNGRNHSEKRIITFLGACYNQSQEIVDEIRQQIRTPL